MNVRWSGPNIILRSKPEIGGDPDLGGKSVALSRPDVLPYVTKAAAHKELIVDASKVTFTAAGAAGLITLLVAGKINAAPAPADNASVVPRDENLKIRSIRKDVLPKSPRGFKITSDGNVKDKLTVLLGFAT